MGAGGALLVDIVFDAVRHDLVRGVSDRAASAVGHRHVVINADATVVVIGQVFAVGYFEGETRAVFNLVGAIAARAGGRAGVFFAAGNRRAGQGLAA